MSARIAMLSGCLFVALLLQAGAARAWGDRGHEVTALIAYRHLTVEAQSALNALLASDADTLTKPDFAGRSTWADKYRVTHRETSAWHFIDIEIDRPDMSAACFGFPPLAAGQAAADGIAQDCIINKVEEFFAELQGSDTAPAERLMALKFLLHLIGDLHQPLHVADHADRGGNCVALSPASGADRNLHAYWDVGAVDSLGPSAQRIAAHLDADITHDDLNAWTRGNARTWAMESFALGQKDVYALPAFPTCQTPGSIALSARYRSQARQDVAQQLEKAGIRIAGLLNDALAPKCAASNERPCAAEYRARRNRQAIRDRPVPPAT